MRRLLFALAILLLIASTWIGLTQGQIDPVQRNILYVHVPNSVCALVCFVVVLVASIGYLVTAGQTWDLVATAAAEAGFVFATILNATGMIFSRAEWNVWWTPSPRLVTSAILWFLYAVYLILRVVCPARSAVRCAFAPSSASSLFWMFRWCTSARVHPGYSPAQFQSRFGLADGGPDARHGRHGSAGRRPDLAAHEPAAGQSEAGTRASPLGSLKYVLPGVGILRRVGVPLRLFVRHRPAGQTTASPAGCPRERGIGSRVMACGRWENPQRYPWTAACCVMTCLPGRSRK